MDKVVVGIVVVLAIVFGGIYLEQRSKQKRAFQEFVAPCQELPVTIEEYGGGVVQGYICPNQRIYIQ